MRLLCFSWAAVHPLTPPPPTQGLHRTTLVFSSAVSALTPRDNHRLTALLPTKHYSKRNLKSKLLNDLVG